MCRRDEGCTYHAFVKDVGRLCAGEEGIGLDVLVQVKSGMVDIAKGKICQSDRDVVRV